MNTLVAYRSRYLKMVRSFFDDRDYLEADTPALFKETSVDANIDPIVTTCGRYLHTSPECAMKRLLSAGSGDIYFLGHVFRKEEVGSQHNFEFTMIEWYKAGTEEDTFLNEVADLIRAFIGPMDIERIAYDDAVSGYSTSEVPENDWDEATIRDYQWSHQIEPNLGRDKITIVYDFPAQDAICAKTHLVNGKEVALRYEFYYRGIELANGFSELSDKEEQSRRFDEQNASRVKRGQDPLPKDTKFLDALAVGLDENTFGMAAGFDRLLMLAQKKENIHDVLLLSTDQ